MDQAEEEGKREEAASGDKGGRGSLLREMSLAGCRALTERGAADLLSSLEESLVDVRLSGCIRLSRLWQESATKVRHRTRCEEERLRFSFQTAQRRLERLSLAGVQMESLSLTATVANWMSVS